MTAYEPEITALLCVDLCNDFLSEGGKLFPWVKDIARENNMLEKPSHRRPDSEGNGNREVSRPASSIGAG